MSDVSTGWGGAWCAYSRMSRDHDREFFDEARRRRDAAIARGDDPYADFRQMVGDGRGGDARLERAWRRIMEDADTEDTMKEAYVDSRQQGLAANASRHSYYHEPVSPTTTSSSSASASRDATKRRSVWRRLFSRRKHHD